MLVVLNKGRCVWYWPSVKQCKTVDPAVLVYAMYFFFTRSTIEILHIHEDRKTRNFWVSDGYHVATYPCDTQGAHSDRSKV